MSIELSKAAAEVSDARRREPPGAVVFSRGRPGFSLRALVSSLDERGAYVKTQSALPRGRKVTVRLKAPPVPELQGLTVDFPGEIVGSRPAAAPGGLAEVFIRWERPLSELVAGAIASRRRRIGALLAALVVLLAWMRWTTFRFFWYDPVFYSYTISVGLFFISRFWLASKHRPPALKDYAPSISVVISIRNEEKAIARTIEACFAAEYPSDRREIIAVDDGSTDGTLRVLREQQRLRPELKVFSIPPSGKRHGMATGFRAAKGELLVVVDSDTFLDRMALRHIVSGFEDPSLGAACGTCTVENADENLLTRMQEVRYLLSFDLMKAPEGVYDAVTCCPGVLSCYRREYLMRILDAWLNQTFLGAPATFGDDRSLTGYILRDYRVAYNPAATCSTFVPQTWRHYLRQQVRWKKSWLRETLIAGTFMHRKHPVAALSFYAAAMCSVLSPFMVMRAAYLSAVDEHAQLGGYLFGLLTLGLTMGLFVLWRRPIRYWYLSWLIVFSQVVLMGPQTYYAVLTMRKNHWGTR